MQSLADPTSSVAAIHHMRLVPVKLERIQWLALPALPLMLLIHPFVSLARKLCEGIVGL